jgi:four helix bundle protein
VARAAFQTLEVYQIAERISDEIWDLVVKWDHFARDTVGKQIVRAADSIGANIAEGFGRGSGADNKRFVRTARGSLNETSHFLRRAFRRGLLEKHHVDRLRPMMDELGPRLNAYLRSIGVHRATTNHKQQTTNR